MSKAKVLLVDDQLLLAEDMKRQLIGLGYEIAGVFTRGDDALQFLEKTRETPGFPDAIIADVSLPGKMNGIELGRIIDEKYNCAVIFISGLGQLDLIEEVLRTKPRMFLIKPFDVYIAHICLQMSLYQSKMEKEILRLKEEVEKLKASGPGSS